METNKTLGISFKKQQERKSDTNFSELFAGNFVCRATLKQSQKI